MLKISNLKKRYGEFLLNCSMEVLPGRITGFVGRNGAGKSTTFKAALGLIHGDAGSIEMFGKDISELGVEDKQKLGVVLSDAGFSSTLSVDDISAILRRMYPQHDDDWFLQQCEHYELPTNKRIKNFSTGMRAKLKLLIAMGHSASLLILDEPTVGLDVVVRDELLDMMRNYMEQDAERSILISSHISSDLENLCDDFYLIHDGRIILHEETDILLSEYAVLKVHEKEYEKLDKQYLLQCRREPYGYRCITNQRRYYRENYPDIVLEKGTMDDVILMMGGATE